MFNELLFFLHIIVSSAGTVLALWHSYGALVGVLSLQLILANLFASKQVVLFGIDATSSEVFFVSSMYGICLLRDYYGSAAARRAVWLTFGAFFLFVLLSSFHMIYLGVDRSLDTAFDAVCGLGFRLLFASMTAYLVSERTHLFLLGFFERWLGSLSQIIAILGGQFVDTVTFACLGLSGVVHDLPSVILFGFLVKIIATAALAPLLPLTHRYLSIRSSEKGFQ